MKEAVIMRKVMTAAVIMLCALLTSCTISQREPYYTPDYTAESCAPEEESAEDIPPAPAGEDGYWRNFTKTDGEGLFDSSFAESLSEDFAAYCNKRREETIQWALENGGEEEAERIRNEEWGAVWCIYAAPTENGAFIIKLYHIEHNDDASNSELYFIPKGGEPVMLSGIDFRIYGEIVGGSYVFWFDAFDSALYRMSEDGQIDSLTLPLDEAYSNVYFQYDPSGDGRFTVKATCYKNDENGVAYEINEMYIIDTEKLEIAGIYKDKEQMVYRWGTNSSSNRRPYDIAFEKQLSEGALRYYGSKEEELPFSPVESDIYITPVTYFSYEGCFVIKIYGLWEIPGYVYYEIYFLRVTGLDENGNETYSDGVLLHSMSGTEDGGAMWCSDCDRLRFYFVYDGSVCRIYSEGVIEEVLLLDRYNGWEFDRSSSKIRWSDNLLNAELTYRSADPETGAPIQRQDLCTVNLDTLEIISYTAGAVTSS